MFNLLIYGMAAAVLFGAVCRLDVIFLSKHKLGWGLMYVCYAGFAASAALGSPEEERFFGLAALGLNLLLTKHLWEEGPPRSVEKQNA